MKLGNLLEELRSTSKPSEKADILLKYDSPFTRHLLKVTYDQSTLFNVKIQDKEIYTWCAGELDLIEAEEEACAVLRFCEHSNSSKQNKEMIVPFVSKLNRGSQELFVGVLNKNWKVGVSSKSVAKLFPGIIKQFNVQLSNKYKRGYGPHKLKEWILSYKLDGLRCVALRESSDTFYDDCKWTLYSRTGKEFTTVEHLKQQLESLYNLHGWTFFDGELYKHGLSFEEVQGPVMAFTQGQVHDMDYHIFVAGDAMKFLANEDPNHVEPLAERDFTSAPNIKFVNIGVIRSEEIEKHLETAFELGYEGIMLRDPNNLYDYKRSNALLKLKSTISSDESDEQGEIISDCIVFDIEYNDKFPVIREGVVTYERLLNRIWVLQDNGVKCKVGSGYSLDFRHRYTTSPLDLIGKVVEVQHQNWGSNGRMRFPRLLKVREDL